MAQPYVGEIRLFAGGFPPVGWMLCDGASLAVAGNDLLFQVIGTTYGGDGQTTFNLPNLVGRVPVHMGTGRDGTAYLPGEAAGVERVTLLTQQMPVHNHEVIVSVDPATTPNPIGSVPAVTQLPFAPYSTFPDPFSPMSTVAVTLAGGGQPHDNMQPFLGLNFIISLFGTDPAQA